MPIYLYQVRLININKNIATVVERRSIGTSLHYGLLFNIR
jgi:hypothetical protein